MEAVAQPVIERPVAWFRDFLKEELSPYSGRLAVVARMVLAATLLVIIFMTFRIPGAPYAALYGLIITREDPQATINAVKTNIIAFAYSAAFVLVGAMLFAGDPMLRLLWVVSALFTMFFGLSAMTNYTAAARFGWMVVILIPIWDEHITGEAKVEGTLWVVGALMLASLLTALLELFFEALHPSKDLLRSLSERLLAVEELLSCRAEGRLVDQTTTNQLTRLTMLGTSRLRRALRRSAPSLNYGEHMGAVVALVGRAVDLAAGLMQLSPQFSGDDRKRLQTLAGNLAAIRADLQAEKVPGPIRPADYARSDSVPLLGELEKTVGLIPEVFAGLQSLSAYPPLPPGHAPPARLLVADAFTNPEHVKFALKGCLAASLCYVIYTSLVWPGISTAVTTCFLTALTTIGASHQKEVLRITGALAGGAAGLLTQIFILPSVDSITGFTLSFLVVTFPAAWLITSGPRVSYFGVQFAYAFNFINLSDFTIQTSLAIPRDRVVGILLGLFMMWLIFDQLWGAPAIVEMKKGFISLLRSLAKLAREPVAENPQSAIEQTYALRETINNDFDKVRAFSDAVLFEFGPTRQQDLALRSRILGWQPQLRILFITRVALLKYRLRLPGFELPKRVDLAQQEFDEHLAVTLDGIADRFSGKARARTESLQDSLLRLEQTIQASEPAVSQEVLSSHPQTFLHLSRRIVSLTISLDRELRQNP
jgi:multidrug resistance protein MdtO